MADTIDTNLAGAGSAPGNAFRTALVKIRRIAVKTMNQFVIWQERSEQRYALSELGDHMLKDIGVSQADAYKEFRKPFWLP